jgi:hypothetical protein
VFSNPAPWLPPWITSFALAKNGRADKIKGRKNFIVIRVVKVILFFIFSFLKIE